METKNYRDKELERSVIATIISERVEDRLKWVVELDQDDFTSGKLQQILGLLQSDIEHGRVSLIKLFGETEFSDFLGAYGIASISAVKELKELTAKRKLHNLAYNITSNLGENKSSLVIQSALNHLLKLNKDLGKETGSMAEAIKEYREASGDSDYMDFNIYGIDRLIRGLKRGRVMVVGGSTGSGKSTLCLQFALRQTLKGKKVIVFSTELTKAAMIKKLSHVYAGVSGENTETSIEIISAMDNLHLFSETRTVQAIAMKIIKEKKINGLDLVIIDHLQDLDTDNYKNEYEMLREASIVFKDLAIKYDTAVVLVSQLNRGSVGAKRTSEVYGFSGSGKIEQVAHIALIIERERDSEGKLTKNAGVIAKKVRSDGITGFAEVSMRAPYFIFYDGWE